MDVIVRHDALNHTVSCFASDDCLAYVYDFLVESSYSPFINEDSKEILPNGVGVTECSIKTKTEDSYDEFKTLLHHIPKDILKVSGERPIVYGGVVSPIFIAD